MEDLDPDLLGSRDGQERGRPVAVEAEVGVGEVVDHHQPVLAREGHDFLEERVVHAERRRVVGNDRISILAFGHASFAVFEPGEEVVARRQRDRPQIAVGDDHRVRVDGVGGVGRQHPVARLQHREGQVGQTLLGPDGDDGFGFGVEDDAVAFAIPAADGHAQAGDAAGRRVAVVLGILRGFDQLGDDVLRGRQVGIAHAEVDDVLTAGRALVLRSLTTANIWGQALDPVEIVHPGLSFRGFGDDTRPVFECQQTDDLSRSYSAGVDVDPWRGIRFERGNSSGFRDRHGWNVTEWQTRSM